MAIISEVASGMLASPYKYSRTVNGIPYKICRVTIHHAAGKGDAFQIATNFTGSRVASANYCIGTDGSCICSVPEEYRAATSSNRVNDAQAITIEVANDVNGEPWTVSEESLDTLYSLLADIVHRNPAIGGKLIWTGDKAHPGNMTVHRWFAATSCPGNYLMSYMAHIAVTVNCILNVGKDDENMKIDIENGRACFDAMELAADAREYDMSPYIDKAVKYGISDGTNPGRPATRGEVMAMMARVYEALADK